MRESFLDKIREHKTMLIQIGVVVAIAVVVSAIMITGLATAKGAYDDDIMGLEGDIARAGASINTLGTSLNARMDGVEAAAEAATSEVSIISVATTENSDAIGTLQTWKDDADPRITELEGQNSPPEGYLTGTVGNYTLHAECSEAGNFTANVHLVYSRAFGYNGTYEDAQQYFYSGINWTQGTPFYRTVITFNGTGWNLGELWWNIGTFPMAANNGTAVAVKFGGLNSTYEPDFAYVEVFPVLR